MDSAVFDRRETTRLGSFEIVRKLARGGMAEIFLARTRGPSGFEKLVVLKKVLPRYASKRRFVQLFLEEAKLAASLDHPHIAQVYDIGMVDGAYFFTMEYLHGQDLRSILHRAWRTGERLPIENAVQIARNVASALHFAHEKQASDGALLGIVHRDVSPSNIIVTYDGATKLLDFGVAKTTASTVKTRTGALKGKVSYMSPEQARGATIDRRSDIFSLGVVMWEMVTVRRLFRGENDLATLQLIINQPPKPPTALRPDCPVELERIVLRALAQDPNDRYPTAEHLVTELDELAREHKLKQSSSALAATIGHLFNAELGAWREARAAGVPLADHLNDMSDRTAPISESDFIEIEASGDDEDDDDVRDGDDRGSHGDGGDDRDGRAALDADGDDQRDDRDDPDDGGDDRGAIKPDDLDELGQLYDRDDDEDDDDEKTEHVPLFGDPFPGLFLGETPRVEPSDLSPPGPATAPHATPAELPIGPDAPTPPVGAAADSPATLIGPFSPMPAAPTPPGTPAAAPSATLLGQVAPVTGPTTIPDAMALTGSPTPSTPLPVIGGRTAPSSPFAGSPVVSNAPFAVPPWQSGQPGGPPTERIEKSWRIIDLPAVDPELFERQRRIVIRVSSGLIAFILLLAIIAGRC